MYFQQIAEIIEGRKFQTRRLVKPGEAYLFLAADGCQYTWTPDNGGRHATQQETILDVYHRNMHRLKWQVGRDYAVSPGRGKPGVWWQPGTGEYKLPTDSLGLYRVDSVGGVRDGWRPLRIVITAIRCERLQAISVDDAIAEGWPYNEWPPTGPVNHPHQASPTRWYSDLWDTINGAGSWERNDLVWALTFEVQR